MDVEVSEKRFNPLLERDEVRFQVSHEGEPTPTLVDVRKLLRAKLNAKAELMVIDSMHSQFGTPISRGEARVYKDANGLKRIEAKHVIRKNFGGKESEGEEKEESAAKEA
jgi:small subunit ribosomal protein S24e